MEEETGQKYGRCQIEFWRFFWGVLGFLVSFWQFTAYSWEYECAGLLASIRNFLQDLRMYNWLLENASWNLSIPSKLLRFLRASYESIARYWRFLGIFWVFTVKPRGFWIVEVGTREAWARHSGNDFVSELTTVLYLRVI